MFINQTYYYASEVSAQVLGTGDGTLVAAVTAERTQAFIIYLPSVRWH